MPIALGSGRFLRYRYNPDYLRNKTANIAFISDPEQVCGNIGIHPEIVTDLIIDGGNVIRCDDAVIMTDKVLEENPGRDVVTELEKLFGWDAGWFYCPGTGMRSMALLTHQIQHIFQIRCQDTKLILANYTGFIDNTDEHTIFVHVKTTAVRLLRSSTASSPRSP